jgi:hypothetical protein
MDQRKGMLDLHEASIYRRPYHVIYEYLRLAESTQEEVL